MGSQPQPGIHSSPPDDERKVSGSQDGAPVSLSPSSYLAMLSNINAKSPEYD